MRKSTFCIAAAIIAVLLSSCAAAQNLSEGRIAPVTLTDRETMLLSAASQKTYAFDFQVDEGYTWVTLSLEKYRQGLKIDGGGSLSTEVDQKGMFVLSLAHVGEDYLEVPQKCTLFVGSEGGWVTNTLSLDDVNDEDLKASAWGMTDAAALPDSGAMALGCVRWFTKGDSISYPPQEFYLDPANHPDAIQDAEVAYVLTCTFSKEAPRQEIDE